MFVYRRVILLTWRYYVCHSWGGEEKVSFPPMVGHPSWGDRNWFSPLTFPGKNLSSDWHISEPGDSQVSCGDKNAPNRQSLPKPSPPTNVAQFQSLTMFWKGIFFFKKLHMYQWAPNFWDFCSTISQSLVHTIFWGWFQIVSKFSIFRRRLSRLKRPKTPCQIHKCCLYMFKRFNK